jgi:hypothetical protein
MDAGVSRYHMSRLKKPLPTAKIGHDASSLLD